MTKKYYVIIKGKKTGIFDNWFECEPYIKGYKGAIYKSFLTFDEAQHFLKSSFTNNNEITKNEEVKKMVELDLSKNITAVFVDGSFNKLNRQIGYGILIIQDSKRNKWIKLFGKLNPQDLSKYQTHLNISGEVFGTIKAVEYCIQKGFNKIKIYFDYDGIGKWISQEWATKTPISMLYFQKMKTFQAKSQIEIFYQKVKAHTDIEFNNIADSLAKKSVGIL